MNKFQQLQATHERNQKQAGHYKGAYERLLREKEELKRKLAEGRMQIKPWQKYVDDLKAKYEARGTTGEPCTPMPPSSSVAAAGAVANDDFMTPLARYTVYNPGDTLSSLNPRMRIQSDGEADQARLGGLRSMPPTPVELKQTKTSDNVEEAQPGTFSRCNKAVEEISRLHEAELYQVIHRGGSGDMSPTRTQMRSVSVSSSTDTTIASIGPHESHAPQLKNVRRTSRSEAFIPPFLHATETTERDTIREGTPPSIQTHYLLPEDDFSPVVVSTRTIKRRRLDRNDGPQDQATHKSRLDNRSADLDFRRRVKDDPDAEGFTRISVARLQAEHSIDDLDTIPGIVLTPKKRNALQRVRSNSHSQQSGHGRWLVDQEHFRSSSVPMDIDDVQNLSTSFRDKLDRRSPMDTRPRVKDEQHDVVVLDHEDTHEISDSPSQHVQSRILQPLSLNARTVLPITSDPQSTRKARRHAEPSRIAALAEDGGQYCSSRKRAAEGTPDKTSRTPRIMNMLEGTSAQKQVLRMSSLSMDGVSPRRSRAPLSPRKDSTVPTASRANRAGSSARALSPRKYEAHTPRLEIKDTFDDDNESRPEESPLRSKPVETLTISDFRINPKHNQGLDYAFSEVIRASDRRQCLPGCTRPDCCGSKFQKILEIGGALPDRGPGLWDDDNKSNEQRILERYLGPDAMARLKRMTSQEVQEMLLKARAENMAQQHGKHKSSWVRSSTPPGFWNADFPSTQEEEENRRKAAKLERDRIAEMRREALRGDGKWLFKDE
jgi:hypothetical protein